jgi:hypothetical protein
MSSSAHLNVLQGHLEQVVAIQPRWPAIAAAAQALPAHLDTRETLFAGRCLRPVHRVSWPVEWLSFRDED